MAVDASAVAPFSGSPAICEALLVAVSSEEADTDTQDSSVLLLSCGESGRSAVVARFCCDLTAEESMLVTDEDSLWYGEMTPRASSWSATF